MGSAPAGHGPVNTTVHSGGSSERGGSSPVVAADPKKGLGSRVAGAVSDVARGVGNTIQDRRAGSPHTDDLDRNIVGGRYDISAGPYGGSAKEKVIAFGDETDKLIGETLLEFVQPTFAAQGLHKEAGPMDKLIIGYLAKMSGIEIQGKITYDVLTTISPDKIKISRLTQKEWAGLQDLMYAYEEAISMVMGLELNPPSQDITSLHPIDLITSLPSNAKDAFIEMGRAVREGRDRTVNNIIRARFNKAQAERINAGLDHAKVLRKLKERFHEPQYRLMLQQLESEGFQAFSERSLRDQSKMLSLAAEANDKLNQHLTGGQIPENRDARIPSARVQSLMREKVRNHTGTVTPEQRRVWQMEAAQQSAIEFAENIVSQIEGEHGRMCARDKAKVTTFEDKLNRLSGKESDAVATKRTELEASIKTLTRTFEDADLAFNNADADYRAAIAREKTLPTELISQNTHLSKLNRSDSDFTVQQKRLIALQEESAALPKAIAQYEKERQKTELARARAEKAKTAEETELAKLPAKPTGKDAEAVKKAGDTLLAIVQSDEKMGELRQRASRPGRELREIQNTGDPFPATSENLQIVRELFGLGANEFNVVLGERNEYFQIFLLKVLRIHGFNENDLIAAIQSPTARTTAQETLIRDTSRAIFEKLNPMMGTTQLAVIAEQAWRAPREALIAYNLSDTANLKHAMRIDRGELDELAEDNYVLGRTVVQAPLEQMLIENEFVPGDNTAAEYITLADGQRLVMVADEQTGENIIYDESGNRMGTYKRESIDTLTGTVRATDPTTGFPRITPPENVEMQEMEAAIDLGLAANAIIREVRVPAGADSYSFRFRVFSSHAMRTIPAFEPRMLAALRGETSFTEQQIRDVITYADTNNLVELDDVQIGTFINDPSNTAGLTNASIPMIKYLFNLATASINRTDLGYVVENMKQHAPLASALSLSGVKNLETKSLELRNLRPGLGTIVEIPSEIFGTGGFRWTHGANEINVQFQDRLLLEVNGGVQVDISAVTDVNDPIISLDVNVQLMLRQRFYELLKEARDPNYDRSTFHNIRVNLTGGKYYDFGIGEHGLVRFTPKGGEQMAMEAINNEFLAGNISSTEMFLIQQTIGLADIHAKHESYKQKHGIT